MAEDDSNPSPLAAFSRGLEDGISGNKFYAQKFQVDGQSGHSAGDTASVLGSNISGDWFSRTNVTQNFRPYYADGSDGYANHRKYFISFQHVPSQTYIVFKAFVGAFNETYKSNWGAESVFGRIDPIYSFKSTDRNITLSLNLPAATEGEAFENLAKVGTLSDMLYPNYTNLGQANTISQSPMIRIKVMNLLEDQGKGAHHGHTGRTLDKLHRGVSSSPAKGLLGVITSLSINHNIDNGDVGVYEIGTGAILPKFMDISVSFDVIHEHTRGWSRSNRAYEGGPYGINTSKGQQGAFRSAADIDNANRGLYDRAERMRQFADREDARQQLASQEQANADARTVSLSRTLRERGADRRATRGTRRGARAAGLSVEQYTAREFPETGGFDFAGDE